MAGNKRNQKDEESKPLLTQGVAPTSLPYINASGENQLPITTEIIESYLVCKTKAYLKLRGQQGIKTEYEKLTAKLSAELRARTHENLVAALKPEKVIREVKITRDLLAEGAAVILNATIEIGNLSVFCDALKRIPTRSCPSGFCYAPVLVSTWRANKKVDRCLLEVMRWALGTVQGTCPDSGYVAHEMDSSLSRVLLRSTPKNVPTLLYELGQSRGDGQPPRLTLNNHCQVCEFRQQCRAEATGKDDISLLRGLTETSISKLRKRGIDTLVQLSRTFRPRRAGKRQVRHKRPHSFGLQAQAIRDNKTYVYGTPSLSTGVNCIFLDMEGDPEQDFVYLIGMIVDSNGARKQFSFWADRKEEERETFTQFLSALDSYPEHTIYHYGNYEVTFLKRMRQKVHPKSPVDRLMVRMVNVLASLYGTIYFPTFSNGLKDVASTLGFCWTEESASGLQSLVWRRQWERGEGDEYKRKLLQYNLEDCAALKVVTERIRAITIGCGAATTNSASNEIGSDMTWAKVTDAFSHHQSWSTLRFACPDFDFINRCSYFDYQQQKVRVRSSGASKLPSRNSKPKVGKARISGRIRLTARRCPECGSKSISEFGRFTQKKLVYDLRFTVSGVKRRVVECWAKAYRCNDCGKGFLLAR